MNAPLWVSEEAAHFWASAGGAGPFPRRLEGAIRDSAFELSVKEVAGLSLGGARRYLAGLGIDIDWACGGPDRPLRACLAAFGGAGLILLDAADGPCERAFSLAHEVAHFLRHYLTPRRRARAALGASSGQVLDGGRKPSAAERLGALLRGVAVAGLHVHLMGRGPRGDFADREVAAAEEEADRLAYELLAPAAEVAALVGTARGAVGRARAEEALRRVFGLPPAQAEDYARLLLPAPPDGALLRRFGAG